MSRRARIAARLACMPWLASLLWLVAAAVSGPAHAGNDTSFLTGPELGARLLQDLVRISASDTSEHGFGLVVGVRGADVYVATARHVVLPPGADLTGGASSRQIQVSFCAAEVAGSGQHAAQIVDTFAGLPRDLALLKVARPGSYQPLLRAIAPGGSVQRRQEVWSLGQANKCGVTPRSGAISAPTDAQGNLRAEFPGVLGGSSGGPAITGYGVVGLITTSDDLTITVLDIAAVRSLLEPLASRPWQLLEADNIPPGEPAAAEMDLAVTLNKYLFGVRNLQQLLMQPEVPKQRFVSFANEYNAAVERFRDARERHDGTLDRFWPEAVLPQWQQLRDQLWQVHLTFWQMNGGDSQAVFDQQRTTPEIRARMLALEPQLVQLESGIKDFLRNLGQGKKS